jgi:hypothetical protein
MSDATQTRRDIALDFLDELDGRHDLLLTELEQLNNRIDSVLNEYAKSRQSAALASGVAIHRSAEGGSAPNDASNSHSETADFD